MSFTLHLHSCNVGPELQTITNQFTGESFAIPVDHGLTASELDGVRTLLTDAKVGPPDPETYCRVPLADGSFVDVAIGTLDSIAALGTHAPCIAFAVDCSALTTGVAEFVYELAKRGNMTIGSTLDPSVVSLPVPGQRVRARHRWPNAIVTDSPAKLAVWLREQIEKRAIV